MRGTGPPVVFSSGLFGICPHQAYNNLIKLLSCNLTILNIENGIKFMTVDDVEYIADVINVDRVGLFTHSSFDPRILESPRLKKAVLCDPIGIPQISNILKMKSFQPYVETDAQILELRANRLYDGKFKLPLLNQFEIKGDVETKFMDCGHVDLMDDSWVWLANKLGFWDMLSPTVVPFENFEYKKKNHLKKLRHQYRQSLADLSTSFFMKQDYPKKIS